MSELGAPVPEYQPHRRACKREGLRVSMVLPAYDYCPECERHTTPEEKKEADEE